jgi:hypothetical protein
MCKKLLTNFFNNAPVVSATPVLVREPLKNFATFAELEAWFLLHDELQMPSPNLCDDYSEEAMILAEVDGYRLSACLVYEGQVWSTMIFTAADLANEADKDPTHIYHIANSARVLADENHVADGVTTKDSSGNILKAGTPLESVYYLDLNWRKLYWLCCFVTGGKF